MMKMETTARHRPGYGAYDTWNPVATALETKIENPTYQNNVNLFLNFKPMKGLSLKIMGGGTFSNSYNSKYENTKTRNGFAMNGVGTMRQLLLQHVSEYKYSYI